MLVRDSVFDWILYNKGINCFSAINIRSVKAKRAWQRKPQHEKDAFSAMMSEKTKKSFSKNSKRRRKKLADTFRRNTQSYWDNISEEDKRIHVDKMKKGMKDAWDNADDDFPSKKTTDFKHINGNIEIQEIVEPKINDYAGVITTSEMGSL